MSEPGHFPTLGCGGIAHPANREDLSVFSTKIQRGVHANEMPIEYLLEIEHSPFPLRVKQPDAIKSIAVLKAVGLVEADIYPPLDLCARFGDYQLAVVSGITARGREELVREWGVAGT
ncbi:hypothetical protein VVAX_06794 [Variovorax paradoxus]|jgi:hypothetical protein|uniref:Uncharacterized protein n=2 Tax=Variovorax paradoxus TaxID=34073 RepID=A0A679JW69_VARPD|nr:hypothetical protein VVAX_06794 [Variovorax paradoxus]